MALNGHDTSAHSVEMSIDIDTLMANAFEIIDNEGTLQSSIYTKKVAGKRDQLVKL